MLNKYLWSICFWSAHFSHFPKSNKCFNSSVLQASSIFGSNIFFGGILMVKVRYTRWELNYPSVRPLAPLSSSVVSELPSDVGPSPWRHTVHKSSHSCCCFVLRRDVSRARCDERSDPHSVTKDRWHSVTVRGATRFREVLKLRHQWWRQAVVFTARITAQHVLILIHDVILFEPITRGVSSTYMI